MHGQRLRHGLRLPPGTRGASDANSPSASFAIRVPAAQRQV